MNVKEIITRLAARARESEIIFPTTAEMAFKIQRLVDNPDCSLDELSRLVQADPLLATRVVAVANAAFYMRSGQPVDNIRTAVSRIGFKTLRVLAASIVVKQMESMATDLEHRQMARQLWERTAHVAALAHLIARRVTHQDPDTACFAGIVHEVGGFYLIARAADFRVLLQGGAGSLRVWGEGGAAEVGRAVLERLGVPAAVTEAVEDLWAGRLATPPVSLGDTLLLACQLAPIESPLARLVGDTGEDIRSRIELAVDQATLGGIIEESKDEVASLISALYA